MIVSNSYAQNDSVEIFDVHREIRDAKEKKDQITKELDDLNKSIDSLIIILGKIDFVYLQKENEIYYLVNADKSQIEDFNSRFESTEKKIFSNSAPLSDIKEFWFGWITQNKIRLLKLYRTRYAVMKEKIDNWKDK